LDYKQPKSFKKRTIKLHLLLSNKACPLRSPRESAFRWRGNQRLSPTPFPAGVDERERRKSRDEVGRLPGYKA